MRHQWRHLPETRTARQLVAAIRGMVEEAKGWEGSLDVPTTNQGAIARETLPKQLEAAYQTTFAATEKLTEQEQIISRLEAEGKDKDRQIKRLSTKLKQKGKSK